MNSKEFAELTDFQRDLLFVINGFDGETGLTIKSELETYYDQSINHGRLYPNLDTLVDEGYVKKLSTDGRSNAYSVTKSGSRLLNERITWEESHQPSTNRTDTAASLEDESEDIKPDLFSLSEPPIDVENSTLIERDINTTLADIPLDEASNAEILLYVTDSRQPSEFKAVDVDTKDLTGVSASFNGWTKHNIRAGLEDGDWFLLSGLRLSRWEQRGEEVRSISTIPDSTIQEINGGNAMESTPTSKSTNRQRGENEGHTSEGDLLEDIYREFDVDY